MRGRDERGDERGGWEGVMRGREKVDERVIEGG